MDIPLQLQIRYVKGMYLPYPKKEKNMIEIILSIPEAKQNLIAIKDCLKTLKENPTLKQMAPGYNMVLLENILHKLKYQLEEE